MNLSKAEREVGSMEEQKERGKKRIRVVQRKKVRGLFHHGLCLLAHSHVHNNSPTSTRSICA